MRTGYHVATSALALAALSGCTGGQAQQNAAKVYEVNVTNDMAVSSGEPQISVDPTNPNNLAIIEFAIGSQKVPATSAAVMSSGPDAMVHNGRVMLSTDGGTSWKIGPNVLNLPGYSYGADPALSYGPDGTIYALTVLNDKAGSPPGDGSFTIIISHSRDGGKTFSAPQKLPDTSPHRPWIEVDNKTGTVYVSTIGFRKDDPAFRTDAKNPTGASDQSRRDAWIVAFKPHLAGRAETRRAGGAGYSGAGGHHLTAANGVVATTFMLGGGGMGAPTRGPVPVPASLRAVVPPGVTSCSAQAPCLFLQTSSDEARTWTVHHVPIPAGGLAGMDMVSAFAGPLLAADPGQAGHFAISFLGQGSTSSRVLVTGDSGKSWTSAQVPPPGSGRIIKPWLEYAPNGVLGYMWKQERPDLPVLKIDPATDGLKRSGPAFDVYAAISCDGGKSWLPPVRVNAVTSPAGPSGLDDMSYLAMDSKNAHLVWGDRRDHEKAGNTPTGFAGTPTYYGRVPFSVASKGAKCGR